MTTTATLTTNRHPEDQAPSGTPPTGPPHTQPIRTLNDANICILNGGYSLGVSPVVEVGFTPFMQFRG